MRRHGSFGSAAWADEGRQALANTERETDYLVVGAGAMGMAFADELLTQRPSARVALVDRHSRPGGHWNDAYSFVSLHQPAAYYGVNSLPLGRGGSALLDRCFGWTSEHLDDPWGVTARVQ